MEENSFFTAARGPLLPPLWEEGLFPDSQALPDAVTPVPDPAELFTGEEFPPFTGSRAF